jgi:hypothetical protein
MSDLAQYQRDVDRTLDEMEGQITDASNQVGVLGLERLWKDNLSDYTQVETCGSINTATWLIRIQFIVDNDTPLITGAVNLQRNNAFSSGAIYIFDPYGTQYTPLPGDANTDLRYSPYGARIDTHNHTTGTTWSQLACSKTIAWPLPNGVWYAYLFVLTDDTGPVGQDCTLVVNSASLSVRSI